MRLRCWRFDRCSSVVLLLLSVPVAAQQNAGAARELTLEDFDRIQLPGNPQVAPDGEHIAYALDGRIFVAAGSTPPRAVTSPATEAWNPRWSADGDSLYFLSDRSDNSQLWQLSIDGFGEAEQITDFEHGIASLNLSPDENRLLLTFSDNDLREQPEAAEPQPFVITRRHFKRDAGEGYITAGQERHLYVYDIEGESLAQITSGDYEERGGAWSPDGRSVVFVSNRDDPDAGYVTDLWAVAADNADKGGSLTRLTANPDAKGAPAFSPDGERIAYLTAVDGVYGLRRLAVIPSSGGDPAILTAALDRWVNSFRFSPDGNWIYFTYENSGSVNLARVRVRDARIEQLVAGEQVISAIGLGRGGEVALRLSGRTSGPDIYRLRGRRLTQLTDLHREFFAEVTLGDKSHVSFESADGTPVEAFITTPPGYTEGRAYPAILHLHGGPVGQFGWGFNFTAQYLASEGYVVIEPNPRGSTGRGQAYINAIYRTWGVPDYHDVIAAVDYAVAQGIADPERLAVTGYSYGGYLTNVVITQTTRFKAAASGAGHSLIEANIGHDIYQRWYFWEMGVPWENRDKYDVVSPLLRAGNVTTPTIFLGGRIDWNVPILNAELFYQALKVQGIDTTLIVYPGMHHGGWSAAFDKDYLQRIADWFDKYVPDE